MSRSLEELAAEHVMLDKTRPVQTSDWELYSIHMAKISVVWHEMTERFGDEATVRAIDNCEKSFKLFAPD